MKEAMNAKPEKQGNTDVSRRRFLGYAGGLAGAALLLDSCKKEDEPVISSGDGVMDLGMNDTGLLNLIFVISQVEAAFFEQVVLTPFSTNSDEIGLITRMRDHKTAHKELIRTYLDGKGTHVTTDFSAINFGNKDGVLENAELLANISTGNCNEAARLLISDKHVEIVAKMGSVNARHAAAISNMRSLGNFFGPVDAIGEEPGILPANAIATINRFLTTKVSGNNLPNK
ncbi:MAG: ferritin-like domain-containing protein [Chitinophagales bacterium]|nr:ferritin-like domain-containing protein [Chitinophagaceae bacterium]MCB9063904.1 ferritin-like domain-containing protein [Chitinophagales bacterium]